MLLMFERGIRSAIAQVVQRYAKASNACMSKKYNPKEEIS